MGASTSWLGRIRLKELRAVCHCGKKATMIVRVNDDGEITSRGSNKLILAAMKNIFPYAENISTPGTVE